MAIISIRDFIPFWFGDSCFGCFLVVLGKTYTANAMRPLPGFLLLCASYGVTAIANDFSTGKNGLDYCIAEADTTSDMTASTTMAAPTCALPWSSLAAPYMPATTWAPGMCEHNPKLQKRAFSGYKHRH